ncbi:hypothetical protein [Streptomyces sporangiiformans]|uniref:Uncharacterized protein n=1 Tax=Streptomyces sporangiiformans TaxID=2315329 RepID=A0A505DSY1_9ACTN|nr:hypothetical protein [Streptomyces sporangiiformans]TPQ24062.1 hypothetical protein FGD71_000840 [Streptomyces sporangiiformans]
MTVLARQGHNKAILFGILALALFTAVAIAGGRWWNERNQPSQASKTDCLLAQKLVDSAQKIPSEKAAIETWVKTERQLRSQIDDGYLGGNISVYNGWAALQAKGEGTPPQKKELQRLAEKANSHCSNAKVTLVFPPIAS